MDSPFVRGHRPLCLVVSACAVAGGLALTAAGIYGLSQNFQRGFTASVVQDDVARVTGGVVLSGFSSFCLSASLDIPTAR